MGTRLYLLLTCATATDGLCSNKKSNVSLHRLIYSTSLSLNCGKFGSPYLGKAQHQQDQRYPALSVCAVFSCVQTMLMHTFAHDSGRKTTAAAATTTTTTTTKNCRTGDSYRRQYILHLAFQSDHVSRLD